MKQIALMIFFLLLACEDNRYERLALEESRRSSKLGESILVDFSGSSIVKIRSSSANEQDVARATYTVRSESLGADVTVQSSDCEPVILDFIITQLNANALECNFQTERLASKAWLQASTSIETVFGSAAPQESQTTQLSQRSCTVESVNEGEIGFRLCLDWQTGYSSLTERSIIDPRCQVGSRASCISASQGTQAAVRSAPLRLTAKIRPQAQRTHVVAILSNLSIANEDFEKLGTSWSAHGVDFIVFTGDTTSRGSIAEGKSFVDALKSHTQIPWFHTLGDRDINGTLADDYIDFLGASSLAFDLEQIRYILLDSANGGLKEPDWLLDAWFSSTDYQTNAKPMKRFVFTHFPPFAANGSNREQFQHIADAADLVQRLEESETVALFTGQSRNEQTRSFGDIQMVDTGSTTTGNLNWTKLTVDVACFERCVTETVCDCTSVERIDSN